MSTVTKILRNYQITIPSEIREKIHLHEGDLVDFEIAENGILLKPMKVIERSQSWFWSKEWQKEENQVEKNFKEGKVIKAKNVKSLLEDLDK